MRHDFRKREFTILKNFTKNRLSACPLQKTKMFEGIGDLIPHTGKKFYIVDMDIVPIKMLTMELSRARGGTRCLTFPILRD
jgi:N-dimethylarginine dimethylaminohydrolase